MSGSAPNAALLIDFDNVTMGMRSDLSKDLRKLLQSEVIRGKVTVQRAYADWRRYPQYIVPLSENSIDLIFAPAYGSSKKNATDIRMAIDGMELIFTRPEIGTYILLTGDSDFSSLVLKLKEYGKYVIGVGIQESSSDILVQNCDEYYSYTNLAGLTKTTETDVKSMDPWLLVEKAVKKMQDRDDVMRSDRLKQVMIEIDSTFDEGSYGFSKFSKFVTEAASRKLISLKKMANGQYEVSPGGARSSSSSSRSGSRRKSDDDRGGRSRSRGDRKSGGRGSDGRSRTGPEKSAPAAPPTEVDSVGDAFALLTRALEALKEEERYPTRDSDVKRKMLEFDGNFDESTLGFSKFSVFLREARDRDVVELERQDGGSYEVSLGDAADAPRAAAAEADEDGDRDRGTAGREREADTAPDEGADESSDASGDGGGPVTQEIRPEDVVSESSSGRRLGPRGGTTRRRGDDGPPPILEGQGRPSSSSDGADGADGGAGEAGAAPADDRSGEAVISKATPDFVDLESLNLPDETGKIVNYLKNYKGVGEKTAQQVVETFGRDTFVTLQERPEALKDVIPAGRADQLLTGWQEDLERRVSGDGGDGNDAAGGKGGRGRRGGRNRRGGRSGRGRK